MLLLQIGQQQAAWGPQSTQIQASVPANLQPSTSPGCSTNRGESSRSCWWSQRRDLHPPACQISLAQESHNNNSHLVSSGPGDELKECPSVSQECLCLAWQVASLTYSGQDVGVENYFCFFLEMTTMAQILRLP